MRIDKLTVLRYRAIFGFAYVLFGGLALWRVLSAHAAPNAKIIGALFGAALVGLGIVRILAFVRARERPPR